MNPGRAQTVAEVMSPQPVAVDNLASVAQAIDLMREKNISALVIDRRDEKDEYGLLTVNDIAGKVIGPDRRPERVSVYEVMSKPILTVPKEMQIKYAIRLLTRFHLSRALVTDSGRLVGIVTLRDMTLRAER